MKKKSRFFVFPTINLRIIINLVCILICTGVFFVSAFLYIDKNINPDFIAVILSSTLKGEYKAEKNITEEILQIASPAVNLIPKELPEEINLPPSPPPVAEPLVYSPTPQIQPADFLSEDDIYITNLSKKSFDKVSLIKKDIEFPITNAPSILILHTHTTESYLPSPQYNYTPTETSRSLDPAFNVTAVGEVIEKILTQNGINVIHDKTVNDYPSYSQSYSKSLKLASSYIEKYPSIKMVIDVHRDALDTGEKTVFPSDNTASQIMLVVGTDASGLNHPAWQTNLSFALKLQRQINSLYPSLARPINLRRERFNQHVAPYSFILEVGTNTNTLDEAKKAAEYFALSLLSLLKL